MKSTAIKVIERKPMNHESNTIDKYINSVKIDSENLTMLWNKGIVGDIAYIAFALSLDIQSKTPTALDVQDFCNRWSVEDVSEQMVEDGWKKKILKPKAVVNALFVLEEKMLITQNINHVNIAQITLLD